ncbi:iron-sulfur cluster assembly accessory protein, partial [Bacillus thuringiensis]|nr:iron-sulfur cluster assembly accessory protein [Bacillus thuringiensis]
MIEVTDTAAYQTEDMLTDAEDGERYVSLAVHGGGSSGLSYG